MMTAHDARNNTDPNVHLRCPVSDGILHSRVINPCNSEDLPSERKERMMPRPAAEDMSRRGRITSRRRCNNVQGRMISATTGSPQLRRLTGRRSLPKPGHGEAMLTTEDQVCGGHLQDGELSGRGDEDGRRQQQDADGEEDGGGDVEAAKNKKALPATDCGERSEE